jgi:hypothetical protein
MQIITHNPYRILGILANASAREKERQLRQIKQYLEAEQQPPQNDYSFPALGTINRTLENVTDAASKLNLDSDKMNAALFWFWKENEITDEPAIDALKEGNINSAIQIWGKLILETKADGKKYWKAVTNKNYSAFHNLSIVAILNNKNDSLQKAICANLKFLESDFWQKLKEQVTDNTYNISKKELQLMFLNSLTTEDKVNISDVVKIIKDMDFSAKQDFLKNISQKFTANINSQIETARKSCTANKQNAATTGENLYKNTKDDLAQLKEIFGVQDFSYSNMADKVANGILQCGIDYFNHYRETSTDPSNAFMELVKIAKSIAVGSVCKQRCDENLSGLKEWIDDRPNREKQNRIKTDLDSLIATINRYENKEENIYNAQSLINDAKPNLKNIKLILGSRDAFYLKLSTNVALQAQNFIIHEVNTVIEGRQSSYYRYELKSVLERAWEVTLLIGSLDLERDFRAKRYNPNRETLKRLWEQVGVSTSTNPTRTRTETTKSKKKRKIRNICIWIMSILFGLSAILGTIYAIWGIDGLANLGAFVGVCMLFGFLSWIRTKI